MAPTDLASTLAGLFDAERAARHAHDELVVADPVQVLPLLATKTRKALALYAGRLNEHGAIAFERQPLGRQALEPLAHADASSGQKAGAQAVGFAAKP